MSLNEIQVNQIERLNFLAQTEDEKNIVVEAAKQICDAESNEAARQIADKYLKKMSSPRLTNMVDVIAILLKGGHIARFTPDFTNLKEMFYLVFIPVPDPPNKKTLVGHIAKKQFNELSNKGIITERKHLQHTDSCGRNYAFYQLAEDVILRFRGEYNKQ